MRVAGERRARAEMTVDYKDVLEQAVQNERWRVLREVRQALEAVPTSQQRAGARWDFETEPRNPGDVKRDALAAVDRVMNR